MKVAVKTKVNIDTKKIDELEGEAKNNALALTADWVLSEIKTSGKVPKDTGVLENSAFVKEIEKNIVQIVFDTPYARRWYFNSENATFRTEYNANAQDHWMDDFINGDRRKELIEMYASFYKDEIGGLIG